MPIEKKLLRDLCACLGEEHVLQGRSVRERATHFWNPEPRRAGAILRPNSTKQIATALRLCHSSRQSVVTHGGLTGLVDGDRSDENDVVLSLERFANIESVDRVGKTLTVQAGCVLEAVQQAAVENELSFGLDLGARGSCTIGGNIATNAGGLSVLKHGMMREQVLGLEVVLMDGTIISSMNAMLKNNAGHDLKQLFIGSEGTLGVITRAVLRLRAATSSVNTVFMACDNFHGVTQILSHLDRELAGQLNAFEVLWQPVVALNTNPAFAGTVNAPLSLQHPYYVIAEARGAQENSDRMRFEQALTNCVDQAWIRDAVIAKSMHERATIWSIRENIELMLSHKPNFVFDISLPIHAMADYIEQLETRLSSIWSDTKLFSYGHVADGNLHIIVAPPAKFAQSDAALQSLAEKINRIVFEPLTALGGSISAEHGIGFSKKHWLHYSRNAAEIRTMQLLKKTFDPHNLLNAGRIVDPC